MPTEEAKKKLCKKCNGAGHVTAYEAPHVVRKWCVCEIGIKKDELMKKQIEARDNEPVWELFTL